MSVAEQVKQDITTAMKAKDKPRVGALRLLLSELQKDAKEGANDEVAVLRRERKRRIEAADTYKEAGRDELEAGERAEAELIAGYLPAEMSDDELQAAVAAAVEQSGASSPKDMGQVMKLVMVSVGDRADGRRVSQFVKQALVS